MENERELQVGDAVIFRPVNGDNAPGKIKALPDETSRKYLVEFEDGGELRINACYLARA